MMYRKLAGITQKMGTLIVAYPLWVIASVMLLLAFPLSHVSQIKTDTSIQGFMQHDEQLVSQHAALKEAFGSDERIVVALQSDTLFTLPFLELLRDLHEDLEANLPFVDDITSLYNVRNTVGKGEKLHTDNLLAPFPSTEAQVEAIKNHVMASQYYKDLFISGDGKTTFIIIKTDGYTDEAAQQNTAFSTAVSEILAKHALQGVTAHIVGSVSLNGSMQPQIQSHMPQMLLYVLLGMMLMLFVLFRRITAVVYGVGMALLVTLTVVGSMAWAGVGFTLVSQFILPLLVLVSMAASVRVMVFFFDSFDATGNKKEAIRETLSYVGMPMLLVTLALVAGLSAFARTDVPAIASFGMFSVLGVIVVCVVTLTLLPALLSLTTYKPKRSLGQDTLDKMSKKLSNLPAWYAKSVLLAALVLLGVASLVTVKMEFSHPPLVWLTSDSQETTHAEDGDAQRSSSVMVELYIDSKKPNAWRDPARLQRLDKLTTELQKYADDSTQVIKVLSLVTIVKETNKALHANSEAYYAVPKEAEAISRALHLFERSGSDDLEEVVDSRFAQTRISVKLHWTDIAKAQTILKHMKEEAKNAFPEDTIVTTGSAPMLIDAFATTADASVSGYYVACASIAFVMMIVLGTLRLGLVGMIPILAPLMLVMLMMAMMGISLDIFTVFIGLFAIVAGLEASLPFMYHFKRQYTQNKDATEALAHTFSTVGKSVLGVTAVLLFGFSMYIFSAIPALQHLALLLGSAIVFACLAALILAPALMMLVAKRGWIR